VAQRTQRRLGGEESERCSTNTTDDHNHDESAEAYVCGDG